MDAVFRALVVHPTKLPVGVEVAGVVEVEEEAVVSEGEVGVLVLAAALCQHGKLLL
jgi:hypothetical protein